jgi:SURF1 family
MGLKYRMPLIMTRAHWAALGLAAATASVGGFLGWAAERVTHSVVETGREDTHTDALLADPDPRSQAGLVAQLVGTYRPERSLLLADQPMYGRSGVYVLTPLELRRGEGRKIIVIRGWMPTDKALKSGIPEGYAVARHMQTVTGRLEIWPETAVGLPGLLRERIGLADFYGAGQGDVLPLVLRETYTPEWSAQDRQRSPVKMHWPDIHPHAARYAMASLVLYAVALLLGLAVLAGAWRRRPR